MTVMTEVVDARRAIVSYAQASGWFERVLQHEPDTAPGSGMTAAFWLGSIGAHAPGSGLASTSVLLVERGLLMVPIDTEPADEQDNDLLSAYGDLVQSLSNDFELGLNVRNVDLLGEGRPDGTLAEAGYTTVQDATYRSLLLAIPVVLNDVWTQAP